MNEKDALKILESLIEQSMAAGLFKKLADLDYARRALHTLQQSEAKKTASSSPSNEK